MPGCIKYFRKKRGDAIPNAFSLTSLTEVAISSPTPSNAFTLSGITVPLIASCTNGGAISVNGGSFLSTPTVRNGDSLRVKITSNASYSSEVTTRLTIGGVWADFTVTTMASLEVNYITTLISNNGAGQGVTTSIDVPNVIHTTRPSGTVGSVIMYGCTPLTWNMTYSTVGEHTYDFEFTYTGGNFSFIVSRSATFFNNQLYQVTIGPGGIVAAIGDIVTIRFIKPTNYGSATGYYNHVFINGVYKGQSGNGYGYTGGYQGPCYLLIQQNITATNAIGILTFDTALKFKQANSTYGILQPGNANAGFIADLLGV